MKDKLMPIAHFRNMKSGNPNLMDFKCDICVKINIKNKKETHIFWLKKS